MNEFFQSRILASADLKARLAGDSALIAAAEALAADVVACFRNGGKVLWCGNGGSAADAQHLAAELSGRFYYDRPPLFSEALHVNTSYLTAVANDYSFQEVYARMVRAMGRPGDILIGMSTSGNSENVVKALAAAQEAGMITAGFTGESGGKMKDMCHHLLRVPSTDTPRIQECHILLGHILCEYAESRMFPRT